MGKRKTELPIALPSDAYAAALAFLFDGMLLRGTLYKTMQPRMSVLFREYKSVKGMLKKGINPPSPEEVSALFDEWVRVYPFPTDFEKEYLDAPSSWFYNYDIAHQSLHIYLRDIKKQEAANIVQGILKNDTTRTLAEYVYRGISEAKWALPDENDRLALIAMSMSVYSQWVESAEFKQLPQQVQDGVNLFDMLGLYYNTRPTPIKDKTSVISAGWLNSVVNRKTAAYYGMSETN